MSNLIDLFKTSKIDTNKIAGNENFFNNTQEIVELNKLQRKFISNVDYTDPKNFAKFGSAEEYYKNAITYINNDYPYDGNTTEKTSWVNSLTELEYHLLNNEYPRYKGHVDLSASQYVNVYSHVKDQSEEAISAYNSGSRYTNNTYIDLDEGITFESWVSIQDPTLQTDIFKISGVSASLNNEPLPLDLYRVYCEGSKFKITDGATTVNFDYTIPSDKWQHYSIFISTNSASLYINGQLEQTISGFYIGPTEKKYKFVPLGLFIVKLSSLKPSTTPYTKYSVFKLGGSSQIALDETRFFSDKRSPEKIGRYWFTTIDGNDFLDDNNSSLVFYYKYNEGWDQDYLSVCLDSSGRKNDGLITNYSLYKQCRKNTSGIDLSGIVRDIEVADPVIAGNITYSTILSSLYDQKIIDGKDYDELNMHALYKKFPSWLLEEEENNGTQHLKQVVQIISSYFDDLYNKIGEISQYKQQKTTTDLDKIYPFYDKIISSSGFDLQELFTNLDIIEKVASRSDTEIYDNKIDKVKNGILQNIYNNLAYILKSKGTEKSVKSFLRSYGISEDLVRLNIYADKGSYQISDKSKEIIIRKKVANLTGSNNMYMSQSVIPAAGVHDSYTLEASFLIPSVQKNNEFVTSSLFGIFNTGSDFREYNTNKLQVYGYIEKNEQSGSRFVVCTGSAGNAVISSSRYYDLYDDTVWNLALRLTPVLDDSQFAPTTHEYTLDIYGINSNSDSVNREFSGSINIPFVSGSDSLTAPRNFYVGARNNNLTGSNIIPTDIKVAYVNYWTDYLENSDILSHNKDITSYGVSR
jgi:hypothetical protein